MKITPPIMTIYDNIVYVNANAPGMLFGKS